MNNNISDIFGKVSPPPGSEGIGADPVAGLGKIIGVGIQLILLIAAFMLFMYLMWGAFDWISSGGEKEKLAKAQNKMTNAVVGIILVIASFTIFAVITNVVLGGAIIRFTGSGFQFNIPSIGQ